VDIHGGPFCGHCLDRLTGLNHAFQIIRKLKALRRRAGKKQQDPVNRTSGHNARAQILSQDHRCAIDDTPRFTCWKSGPTSGAKLAGPAKDREDHGSEAKKQKAKRDALVAERGDLGTAKVEPGVEAAASGFVVLLAKPDGKGGVKVHGASNDDGVVDRTLALVAKNVRL
jgi:hypothetical protein